MSEFVIHESRAPHERAVTYGIRETLEDLLVWQDPTATAETATALLTFLNGHAMHIGAHEVRRILCRFGGGNKLEPLGTPPSAVQPDRVRVLGTDPNDVDPNGLQPLMRVVDPFHPPADVTPAVERGAEPTGAPRSR